MWYYTCNIYVARVFLFEILNKNNISKKILLFKFKVYNIFVNIYFYKILLWMFLL